MKKIIKFLLPGVMLVCLTGIIHGASVSSSWEGNVQYYQMPFSYMTMPNNSERKVTINWTDAASSDSFKVNFRVKNNSKNDVLVMTLPFCSSFTSGRQNALIPGNRFWLYGDREHYIDPAVYIWGNWKLF